MKIKKQVDEKVFGMVYCEFMIRKIKEGYRVVAESERNMGTYPSLEGAKKRLRQIEMFKHMRKRG